MAPHASPRGGRRAPLGLGGRSMPSRPMDSEASPMVPRLGARPQRGHAPRSARPVGALARSEVAAGRTPSRRLALRLEATPSEERRAAIIRRSGDIRDRPHPPASRPGQDPNGHFSGRISLPIYTATATRQRRCNQRKDPTGSPAAKTGPVDALSGGPSPRTTRSCQPRSPSLTCSRSANCGSPAAKTGPNGPYVWRTLLTHHTPPPATLPVADLLTMGERWLTCRPRRLAGVDPCLADPPHAPRAAARHAPRRRLAHDGRTVARRPRRPARAEWAYVWQTLLTYHAQLPATLPVADLLTIGERWLAGREDRPQPNYFRRTLLTYHSARSCPPRSPSPLPGDVSR